MGTEQRIKREPRRGVRNSPLVIMWIEFLSPLRGLLLLIGLGSHGLRRGLHSCAPSGLVNYIPLAPCGADFVLRSVEIQSDDTTFYYCRWRAWSHGCSTRRATCS